LNGSFRPHVVVRAIFVDGAAAASLALLLPAGGLRTIAVLVGLAGLLLARAVHLELQSRGLVLPDWIHGWIPFILIPLVLAVSWIVGLWGATAVTLVLVSLVVERSATAITPADDRRILLLVVLVAVYACTLPFAPLALPPMLVLALLLPGGLILCSLGEMPPASERTSPGGSHDGAHLVLIGALCLALSSIVAVLLPRPRDTWVPLQDPATGFGADVNLDQTPEPSLESVVLRAKVRDLAGNPVWGPFYFRGLALDDFDGRAWTASSQGAMPTRRLSPGPAGRGQTLVVEALLEPATDSVVFGIPDILSVNAVGEAAWEDGNGAWHVDPTHEHVHLLERSILPDPTQSPDMESFPDPRFTALPVGLDRRIAALAWSVAAGAATPRDRALALQRYLRENYRYDVDSTARSLEAFFFESHVGTCEHFASGLAVLARAVGLPARVANGFHGGTEQDGVITLRTSDAHAWTEIWDGSWQLYDATPVAEVPVAEESSPSTGLASGLGRAAMALSSFDRRSQLRALERLRDLLVGPWGDTYRKLGILATVRLAARAVGVLLGVVVVLGSLGRWATSYLAGGPGLTRRPEGLVHRRWMEAREVVRRRGWLVPSSLPPLEGARWLEERAGVAAGPFRELACLHYRVRYGAEDDEALASEASRQLRALGELPKKKTVLRGKP
jgi:transglutaminase-like putative cysteine protease